MIPRHALGVSAHASVGAKPQWRCRQRDAVRRSPIVAGFFSCITRLPQDVLDNHYTDTPEFHAIPGSMIIDRFGYKEWSWQ